MSLVKDLDIVENTGYVNLSDKPKLSKVKDPNSKQILTDYDAAFQIKFYTL